MFAQTEDVTFLAKASFVRPPNGSGCFTFVRRTNCMCAAQIVISRYKHAQVCRRACATLRDIRFRLLYPHTMKRFLLAVVLLGTTLLSGCGVVAAPCRIASAGLKMVPLVGHVAAAPTDACADIID